MLRGRTIDPASMTWSSVGPRRLTGMMMMKKKLTIVTIITTIIITMTMTMALSLHPITKTAKRLEYMPGI